MSDSGITIFMYHDVRDPDASRWPARYLQRSFLDRNRFASDLAVIDRHYRIVPLSLALAALDGRAEMPERAGVLTFDDGLRDHADTVLPMLAERGLSGCFFLPSQPILEGRAIQAHKIQFIMAAMGDPARMAEAVLARLDALREEGHIIPDSAILWQTYSRSQWADNHWPPAQVFVTRLLRQGFDAALRRHLVDHLFARHVTTDEADFSSDLYLSPGQVRLLAEAGMELGGHGSASFDLSHLSEAEAEAEIADCFQFLKTFATSCGGSGRPAFSYPHGGHDPVIERLLAQNGFAAGLTTEKRLAMPGESAFRLPRFDGSQDRPWEPAR